MAGVRLDFEAHTRRTAEESLSLADGANLHHVWAEVRDPGARASLPLVHRQATVTTWA